MIGYQLAAGGLGGGAVPALAGLAAAGAATGLAPFLVTVAIVHAGFHLVAGRLTPAATATPASRV